MSIHKHRDYFILADQRERNAKLVREFELRIGGKEVGSIVFRHAILTDHQITTRCDQRKERYAKAHKVNIDDIEIIEI